MEQITYTYNLIIRAISSFNIKLFFGVLMSVFSFFFDSLQHDALIALLVLIIMDFLTALLCVYKTKEEIKSKKVFRTSLKIAVYFLLISAGFMAEKCVPIGFIDNTLISFLVVTELISILENTSKAGYPTPIHMLKKLKEFVSSK